MNVKMLTLGGVTMSQRRWARRLGITAQALSLRLRDPSWTIEMALTTQAVPAGSTARHRKRKQEEGFWTIRNRLSWRERRALGLCGARYCRDAPKRGIGLCERHRREVREANRKRRQELYWERKTNGMCVTTSCPNEAASDGTRCDAHREQDRLSSRRRGSTERRKERVAITQRRVRARRKEAGVCFQCNQPLSTDTRCAFHAAKQREYLREWRRARGIPPSTGRCSGCGETGHRIEGCDGVETSSYPLEHYATSRSYVEVG